MSRIRNPHVSRPSPVRSRALAGWLVTATVLAASSPVGAQTPPEVSEAHGASPATVPQDTPSTAVPPDGETARSAAEARLESLEKALAAEQARRDTEVAALRQELERLRAAAQDTPAASPQAPLADLVNLKFSGFLQADAVLLRGSSEDELNPSTGEPLNQTRFLVRRARVRADLVMPWISGGIELDGNTVKGATARLQAAEAALRYQPDATLPPLAMLTLGLFKTPWGHEVLESDRDRLFLERGNASSALFPGEYDLGAKVSGGWRFLRYALGVMNGHPLGEKAFPGRDPLALKDVVGRVGVDTRLETVSVQAGFSFLTGHGFTPGVAATKDQLVWRDINEDNQVQLTEIQVIAGYPAQPSQRFARDALGGDLTVTVPLGEQFTLQVFGELYWANNLDRAFQVADPVGAGRALRELGYVGGLTAQLGRYGVAGVRYDFYNPDRDASEVRNGAQVARDNSLSTLALVVGVQLPPHGRLVLEYDHNTNSLGRDTTGAPAPLPDDALTVRAQVAF